MNRFDLNVRGAARIVHPLSGAEYRVGQRPKVQSFRRSFGAVLRFALVSGLLKKSPLHLVAVRLEAGGLTETEGTASPAADILQRIAGEDGLDFQDQIYYCLGIFSPVGWPDVWRSQSELRGNAVYYFVEKREGTLWQVSGHPSPLQGLFDPETESEKRARAEDALSALSKLVLPGNQILIASFLESQCLDRITVEAVIDASDGRFQIIEHKGKSYIQRSIR